MKNKSSNFYKSFAILIAAALWLGISTAALAWTPTHTSALGYTADMLNHFNVTTLNDFSSGSDVEGRTYIGRNFTGVNSVQFALHLNAATTTDDALVVISNIVAGDSIHIESGSAYVGGSTNSRTLDFHGGGSKYSNPQPPVATVTARLQSGSSQLGAFTANNSVTVHQGQATFNITTLNACGFAVFSINAADIFSNQNVNQVDIAFNSTNPSGIIINVAGTSMSWTGNANLINTFTNSAWRSKILWNFYQATSLNFQSRNMMGAVLAPLADATASGNMDGHVAFKSLQTSSEAHLYSFTSDLSCLTPTASELGTFTARSAKKGITVRWHTVLETDIHGFNVLRSKKKNGSYHQVNASEIQSAALGMNGGAAYKFVDAKTKSGKRYFYKIELVKLSGATTEGPVAAVRK